MVSSIPKTSTPPPPALPLRYLNHVNSYSELPPTMTTYKTQQFR